MEQKEEQCLEEKPTQTNEKCGVGVLKANKVKWNTDVMGYKVGNTRRENVKKVESILVRISPIEKQETHP